MESAKNSSWFEQFRNIILAYNEKRQPDPFMQWFKENIEQRFFIDEKKKIVNPSIQLRYILGINS